jgi:hypothetical protein
MIKVRGENFFDPMAFKIFKRFPATVAPVQGLAGR